MKFPFLLAVKVALALQGNEKIREEKVRKLERFLAVSVMVRELGTPDEFAISEEGRLWDGEDGTKYLSDGLRKLPKTMRDTLAQKVKSSNLVP